MSEEMLDEEINRIAKEKAKKKTNFYGHFGAYAGVNCLLIGVWALTDVDYPWYIWSWIIWGIVILFHYLWVFVFDRKSNKEVE
jgi:hypothetical protein